MTAQAGLMLGLWLLGLSACSTAHYPINPPLSRVDPDGGYRSARFFDADPDDHLFIHVSFSGGGARAAALGYGVLETLRDTVVPWEGQQRRLIDEVDMVMGVSGGSILATAFALKGTEGLSSFEQDFLYAPVQDDLLSRVSTPRGWWRLSSPRFGRSELLAETLDDALFHGATFGTLNQQLRKPYALIYASDMIRGTRFEFSQDQFDFLCSDLGGVSLARAVAASSAAPVVLSPVTVWNHTPAAGRPDCGEPAMRRIARHTVASAEASQRRIAGLEMLRQADDKGPLRPYVHLLDGGLSDNIGARGPIDYVAQFGSLVQGVRYAGLRGLRRMVFVVVNAETSVRAPEDMSPNVPGPLRTNLALADIPINRNSSLALAQMRSTLVAWEREVAEAHARGDFSAFAADAKLYLIEVNLDAAADPALREHLKAIPTTLTLPAEEVHTLRAHAREALARSPEFQRLLADFR